MLAYHGDESIKRTYLARIQAHALADEIRHGYYWQNGKGCAVGCTVHSGSHKAFEIELGIPMMLAHLEDRIFEGLKNGAAKEFPERFLSAITPGADLSCVGWQFLHWLLTEELAYRDDLQVSKQIKACADVLIPLMKGEPANREEVSAARRGAWDVSARARRAVAAAAAVAAYAAAAADAAAYAAAAAVAAYAAAAADAAAYAAAAADAAAYDDGRSKCFGRMAAKLIELLAVA